MRINNIPKRMNVADSSIFQGVRYCYCYSDGNHSTVGDPYGYIKKYDYKNAISVLWDKEELLKFRPSDTTHGFQLFLNAEMQKEISVLRKLIRKAPTNYKGINLRQRYMDRVDFLEKNTIVFVEIHFGEEERSTEYYS